MKTLLFLLLMVASFEAFGESDVMCLAKNIYHEARGEGEEGMIAVAFVTMNRVDDKRFPDNVCDVVRYQVKKSFGPVCAFSWVCEGKDFPNIEKKLDKKSWMAIAKFARAFYHKWNSAKHHDITSGATHYHATHVNPMWASIYEKTTQIGNHIFYYAEKL